MYTGGKQFNNEKKAISFIMALETQVTCRNMCNKVQGVDIENYKHGWKM